MAKRRKAALSRVSALVVVVAAISLGGCAGPNSSPQVASTATQPGDATSASAQPHTSPSTGNSSSIATTMARPKAPVAVSADELAARITKTLGRDARGVSVTVHNRRTGVTTRVNPGMKNCSGSIVKVMILVAVIRERREQGRGLTSAQRHLSTQMIRFSDNDAAETLFRQVGGPRALAQVAEDFGMTRTEPEWAWGRTTTTASDQALLMDRIVGGTPLLHADDRAYILDLMDSVVDEQSWGVGTVPTGVVAQLKNGWVELAPRGWRVNSIGHVQGRGRDYTMAMLSYDNATFEDGVDLLDDVSRVVYAADAA